MNPSFSERPCQPSKFREFDCSCLKLLPLSERSSDLHLGDIADLESSVEVSPVFKTLGCKIRSAKKQGASVILMMGAHVIRSGVQKYLIDLMEQGYISCLAMNGAGVIHDFEFALTGATTESVECYVRDGRFGLWKETGRINDIVSDGAAQGMGLGESVGMAIHEGDYPHKNISLFAAAFRLGIPATVHVGIGYDIIHQFPNFSGAAFGQTSHRDFLRFTHVMESLEHGVVMNFGSAVMAPEVYLKALSMVRNKAFHEGRTITRFSTLVCDLVDLPEDFSTVPLKTEPGYYFRPWKTMLVRTVKDGGESHYVRGEHKKTIPQLWAGIVGKENL